MENNHCHRVTTQLQLIHIIIIIIIIIVIIIIRTTDRDSWTELTVICTAAQKFGGGGGSRLASHVVWSRFVGLSYDRSNNDTRTGVHERSKHRISGFTKIEALLRRQKKKILEKWPTRTSTRRNEQSTSTDYPTDVHSSYTHRFGSIRSLQCTLLPTGRATIITDMFAVFLGYSNNLTFQLAVCAVVPWSWHSKNGDVIKTHQPPSCT